MRKRYVAMLLATAGAGGLSGTLWLVPNGLMGAALGMSLAAGAIWLGERQKEQGGEIRARQVWQAGFGSGLLAGIWMTAISEIWHSLVPLQSADGEIFGPPVLPFWAPLVMGILYGPVVHLCYATRLSSRYPRWEVHLWTCSGCFVLKTVATTLYLYLLGRTGVDPFHYILIRAAMLSAMGAVLFAALWVMVMKAWDPAWSLRPATEAGVEEKSVVQIPK